MLRGYSKFLDVLEKVEKAILAVTVGIMVIIIAYQVIMRYIFAHANSWSEELARYLFIYDVMIGAAIAIRRNSHLQIDILINLMKPKVRTILTIIATLAGMVFMVFLLSYSITLVQTGARTMSAGLGIPMSIPYSCMPVGIVLMLLTSIEVLFKNISALRRGRKGGPGMNAGLLIIILLLGLALLGFLFKPFSQHEGGHHVVQLCINGHSHRIVEHTAGQVGIKTVPPHRTGSSLRFLPEPEPPIPSLARMVLHTSAKRSSPT